MSDPNKVYYVKFKDEPEGQAWTEDKMNRNRADLLTKYPDVEISEFTDYDRSAGVGASEKYYVKFKDEPEGQMWTGDKFMRNKDALYTKYPDVEVKRYNKTANKPIPRTKEDSLMVWDNVNKGFISKFEGAQRNANDSSLREDERATAADFVQKNQPEYDRLVAERAALGGTAPVSDQQKQDDEKFLSEYKYALDASKNAPEQARKYFTDYLEKNKARYDSLVGGSAEEAAPAEQKQYPDVWGAIKDQSSMQPGAGPLQPEAPAVEAQPEPQQTREVNPEQLAEWNKAKQEFDDKKKTPAAKLEDVLQDAKYASLWKQKQVPAEGPGSVLSGAGQGFKNLYYTIDYLGASALKDFLNPEATESKAALAELERREKEGIPVNRRYRNAAREEMEQLLSTLELTPEQEKELRDSFKDRIEREDIAAAAKDKARGRNANTTLRKFMRENSQQDYLINEALEANGGDVEAAKRQLAGAADTASAQYFEKDMAYAAKGIEQNSAAPKNFWGSLGGMIPMIAPTVAGTALSVATGSPYPAMLAGKVVGGAFAESIAGSQLYQARQYGASEPEAWASALLGAATMYLTSQIPFNKFTNEVFAGHNAATVSEIEQALAKKGSTASLELDKLYKTAKKAVGGELFSAQNWSGFASQLGNSAASFSTMTALESMIPMIYENPEDYPTLNELLKNWAEGAKDGLVMGALMGSAQAAARWKNNLRRWDNSGALFFATMENPAADVAGSEYVAEIIAINGKPMRRAGVHARGEDGRINSSYYENPSDKQYLRFGYDLSQFAPEGGSLDGTVSLLVNGQFVNMPMAEFAKRVSGIGQIDAKNARVISNKWRQDQAYENGRKQITDGAPDDGGVETRYLEAKASREEQGGGITPDTASDVSVAEAQRQGQKDALRDEITQRVGRPFWHNTSVPGVTPEGGADAVHTLTLADGRSVFVVGETDDMFSYIDEQGKNGVVARGSDTITNESVVSLDEYLDAQLQQRDVQTEQQRIAGEFTNNLAAVQAQAQLNAQIPLGTPEAQVYGTIIEVNPAADGGVTVQVPGEAAPRVMDWKAVAAAYDMPLEPKSNEQIIEDRLEQDEKAKLYNDRVPQGAILRSNEEGVVVPREFVEAEVVEGDIIIKARDPETGEIVDLVPEMIMNLDSFLKMEAVSPDVAGAPVPGVEATGEPEAIFDDPVANELGISSEYAFTTKKGNKVVNSAELWKKNPRLWAQWNDRNTNRDIATKPYLEAKLAEINADVAAAQQQLQNAALSGADEDVKEGLRDALTEKTTRQLEVQSLYNEYVAAEEAAVAAAKAEAEAAAKEEPEMGPFGTILRGYEGKPKEAIQKLIEMKEGEAVGALYHPEIGFIDLVWGDEGTGHSDGYGLAKLVKYHPEVVDHLQEMLDDMHIVSQSDNRINLESEKYKAAVRLDWDNEKKTWLLTLFEKKNSALDNTTDTVKTSKGSEGNDTATPQDTVSGNKDNTIVGENQTTEDVSPKQAEIAAAREEVDTNPTEAQKEAGNYKKGHITLDGYDITLENPKGSTRSGVDASGKEWSQVMNNDYGYIRMTEGVDGDHIDVFLSDNPEQGNVFVVDQMDPSTGEFDEHKVMYGFNSAEEAAAAYLSNYEEGWQGLGIITEVSKDEFKKWIDSSTRKTKPFAEYKSVDAISGQNAGISATSETESGSSEKPNTQSAETPAEAAPAEPVASAEPAAEAPQTKIPKEVAEARDEYLKDVIANAPASAFAPFEKTRARKLDLYKLGTYRKSEYQSNGVFYADGYKIATDGQTIVAIKEDYPKHLEFALIGKDGNLSEAEWPKIGPRELKNALNKPVEPSMLDWKHLTTFVDFVRKKEGANGFKTAYVGIPIGDNIYFFRGIALDAFLQGARAIDALGLGQSFSPEGKNVILKAESEKGAAIVLGTTMYRYPKSTATHYYTTPEEMGSVRASRPSSAFSALGIDPHEAAISAAQMKLNEIKEGAKNATTRMEKVEVARKKAQALQEMYDRMGKSDTFVSTYEDILAVYKRNGARMNQLEDVEKALERVENQNDIMQGFHSGGKVYIIADDIRSAKEADEIYEHEDGHRYNEIVDSVTTLTNTLGGENKQDYREMEAAVHIFHNIDFYDGRPWNRVVDELLSIGRNLLYAEGEAGMAERLRKLGIDNEKIINFVIDNAVKGKEYEKSITGSRRNNNVNQNLGRGGTKDVRTSQGEPGGVGRQGHRPVLRSIRSGASSPAEEGRRPRVSSKDVMAKVEDSLAKDGITIDEQAVLDKYGLKNVTLSKHGDVVTLTHFIAGEQGKGNGTRFMTDLVQLADQNGWTLALTPDTTFGATSVGRLKDFYKRFGFKENKGRNADLSISESMVRTPISDADGIGYSVVTNKDVLKRFDEAEKTGEIITAYREVAMKSDDEMGSPMAGTLGRRGAKSVPTSTFRFKQVEQADEHPEIADENGKVNLNKPLGRGSVDSVDYNPYIHSRPDRVNLQFKQAWFRDELKFISTHIAKWDIDEHYHAEKAALPTGIHDWSGGGTLILSRYDKPQGIEPWEKVADDWVEQLKVTGVQFQYVNAALLPILAERGVEILPPTGQNMDKARAAYEAWKAGDENGYNWWKAAANRRDYGWKAAKADYDAVKEINEPTEQKSADLASEVSFSFTQEPRLREESEEFYNKLAEKPLTEKELEVGSDAIEVMVDYMQPYLDKVKDGKRYLPEEIFGKGWSTIFENGSYGKTMENTLICMRTLAYNDFVNAVQEKIGRPLTVTESFLASQMLYDIATDPQCLYCYVSLDRKAYNEFLKRYIEQRDAAIDKYIADDSIDRSYRLPEQSKSKKDRKSLDNSDPVNKLYNEYLDGRADTPTMRQRFNGWLDDVAEGTLIKMSDLTSAEKRQAVALQGDSYARQIEDAEKYAQGASWAKKQEEYRAYNGELLKMPQRIIDLLNSEYGLRFYSFSEYSPAFIVENMQMVRDAALRNLVGLAYTKEVDFAKIFAPTGININISTYGREAEDGTVVMDTKQGADWNEAQALREKYGNVGVVFVATNDKMVEWAINQPWIDVVIPFHIVRTGEDVASFYKWTNYTSMQADKDATGHTNYIVPTEHKNDKETFLALCEERGLTPRFADLILPSTGRSVVEDPNYMKLVNETRRSIEETVRIKPVFNLDAAKESFAEFVDKGGYYGGWFIEEGAFEKGVEQVAEDVLAGKTAKDVDYGRQDIKMSAEKLAELATKKTRPRTHQGTPLTKQPSRNDTSAAKKILDAYENQDGGEYPWMSRGELVGRIERDLPKNERTKGIFDLVARYHELEEADFDEGRRDFSGGELADIEDALISDLEDLSEPAIGFSITTYHGSGADFDRFDHSHMGEGEGGQAFGYGTYVSTNRDTGLQYARTIGGAENGRLYTVEIPDDNGQNYIHWDKPITKEQSAKLIAAIREQMKKDGEWYEEADYELESGLGYGTYGSRVEGGIDYFLGDMKNYSTGEDPGAKRDAELLRSIGIVGFEIPVDRTGDQRYEGSNYVIFDENDLNIVDKTKIAERIASADTKQKAADGKGEALDQADIDEVSFSLSRNNKAIVSKWLEKRTDLTEDERGSVLKYIDGLDNPKLQLATARWFAGGTIRLPEDMEKVQQAVSVAEKAKVDPLQYDSPMALLDTHADFKPTQKRINPAEVPTLHKANEYPQYGIVTYDVDNSQESREWMRKIINTHYGEDASPWCLLQGDGKGNLTADSEFYWNRYNAYPKQVAFRDGKLLAFSANDNAAKVWWDRKDAPHYGIPISMKMPGDELGRSATYRLTEGDGALSGPTDIHRGNKQNGTYEEWDSYNGQEYLSKKTNYKNGVKDGIDESYDENGTILRHEEYRDGHNIGEYKKFFKDGTVYMHYRYDDNGARHGEQLIYKDNGNLQHRTNYEHGLSEGFSESWDDNGTLRRREEYHNGRLDGISQEFYADGKPKYENHYKDGHANGVSKTWFENGKLESESTIKNGMQVGTARGWYENGKPAYVYHYNQEGEESGVQEDYYSTGELQQRSHYRGGKKNGTLEQWWRNGQLKYQLKYKEDRKEGFAQSFFDNGQVNDRTTYKDNKEDGIKEMFDSGGHLWYRHLMRDGKEGRFLGTYPQESAYTDEGKVKPEWKRVLKESDRFNEDTDDLRFSITNRNQEIFVSNAEKAVEDIKNEKATPEQWLNQLTKNGGLKAAEDKWLGLSDWLKVQNKKTITKQEILDFIEQNRIQIEEQHYGDTAEVSDERALQSYQDEFEELIAEGDEATGSVYTADHYDYAWKQMVERYGDDFAMAFDYETGPNGAVLVPQTDWNEELTGQARYFLDQRRPDADVRRIPSIRLKYTTPGLKNKREIALTVPTIKSWKEDDTTHFGDAGEGRAVAWSRFGDAEVSSAKDAAGKAAEEAKQAWLDYKQEITNKYALKATGTKPVKDLATPEENARMQELYLEWERLSQEHRHGQHPKERVLVIDEIQSKRHQEGREKGYRMTLNEVSARVSELGARYGELLVEYGKLRNRQQEIMREIGTHDASEIMGLVQGNEELAGINERLQEISREMDANKAEVEYIRSNSADRPEPAPFEKNWHELAMKRMLRLAAEEGYDYVAWTTGEQQAERYNIGNVLDRLVVERKEDGTYDVRGHRIDDLAKNDEEFAHDVKEEGLAEVVGKDIAKKAIENEEKVLVLEGENLRIGAEGMKGFYDSILVNFMNKYGKKWGVQVQDLAIPGIDETRNEDIMTTMHAVPVTAEMRESVMEGQPMFSVKGRDDASAIEQDLVQERLEAAPAEARQQAVVKVEEDGLSSLVGDDTLQAIYRRMDKALPSNVSIPIIENGIENGFDFKEARREFWHGLAERGFENDETGALREMCNELRWASGVKALKEEDARYMLWYDTLEDKESTLSKISSIAFKRRWGVAGEEDSKYGPSFSIKDVFSNENNAARQEYIDYVKAEEDAKKAARKAVRAELKAAMEAHETFNEQLGVLAKGMSAQRAYDTSTVKGLVKFAREVMKEGLIDNLSTREVNRLLTLISSATGKSSFFTTRYADDLMDTLLGSIMKGERERFNKIARQTGAKVDKKGVEVKDGMDVTGQVIMKAFRDNMNLSEEELQTKLAELSNKMDSDSDAIKQRASMEYEGVKLAEEYRRDIAASEQEELDLRNDWKDALEEKKHGGIDRETWEEYLHSIKQNLRTNMIERIDLYRSFGAKLNAVIAGSTETAKLLREADERRIDAIHAAANFDLYGVSAREHRRDTRLERILNSDILRFFFRPLATFDQMLRQFGRHSVSGEGYLWNRFMRQWVDSANNSYKGLFDATKELDKKASEIFGQEMMWSDLYGIERKMPGAKVKFLNDGVMEEHELTPGNLLYIYMVNKMADGKMKLRKMGISEEDVQNIARSLDQRFIQLADWLQDEYLVQKRNKYNEVHERLFGAPMASISDYFPLKILANARVEEVDLGANPDGNFLSSTTTGSVIKRRKNSLALDLLHTDAFSLVIEHLQQMEDWAAFAEFRRDVNTLLSYKHFRNQVQNMNTIYGSGKDLWKNFKDVASIASGSYRPKASKGDIDTTAVNIAKGVTAAKIAFRVNTALKQLLSFPAYLPSARIDDLVKSIATAGASWNWCMDNLPVFHKRWHSRLAGDTRLMDTESDWKIWRKNAVKTAARFGMTPNAFVDALTVAVGTKAMYDTAYRRYIEDGYTEEEADKKAKQNATILYNQTQQSEENPFVSTIQLDRTWLSVLLSTYRNSSMSYQRRLFESSRNLARMLKPGYKEATISSMTKQRMAEGVDEENAREGAEREYNREKWRAAVNVAIFGFGLQLLWNIGNSMWYILFGDDEKEKEKMFKDAATKALAGPVEGLTGGNVVSDAWSTIASGGKVRDIGLAELPAVSDLEQILKTIESDTPRAISDIVNLVAQSGFGVNPQTFTDVIVGIIDACNGNLDTAKEVAILLMRIAQIPQSVVDEFIIDEIGMTGREAKQHSAEEIAQRYADYKLHKNAPYTNYMYTDEEREKRLKNYAKNFNKKVKEREKLHMQVEPEETE